MKENSSFDVFLSNSMVKHDSEAPRLFITLRISIIASIKMSQKASYDHI